MSIYKTTKSCPITTQAADLTVVTKDSNSPHNLSDNPNMWETNIVGITYKLAQF